MYQRIFKILFLILSLVVFFSFKSVLGIFQCSIGLGDKSLARSPINVLAVLNCTLNGRSANVFKWTLDGKQVKEEHTLQDPKENKKWSAVVLKNMTKDIETYKCKAERGKENASCSVSPAKPKAQTSDSAVRIVDLGNTPELECRAYGWPVPRVSWWLNGSQIHHLDAQNTYLLHQQAVNVLSMKILIVREEHQHSKFTCRADNVFGTSERSVEIQVRRIDMIDYGYREKFPIPAVIGTSATLECICTEKNCTEDTTQFYWKRNGTIVSETPNIRLSREVLRSGLKIALTILNVSKADEGDFFCRVSNSIGFEERRRTLQILARGFFSGSPARLTCKVSYPAELLEPDTYWIFNNTRIHEKSALQYYPKSYGPREGANSTEMVLFQLQMSNVSDQFVGWYTCAADFKIILVKARVFVTLEGEEGDDDEGIARIESDESPLVAISSITAGGVIMGFIAALFAYRLCRKKRSDEEPFFETPVNGRQFRYDVFVTFSSQDLNWVKKELLPLLDKHKLKYCIHDRDFQAGKPVVDNMAESVYTSRKVLAVMSHNYMSSKFCRGELEMALYRSTEMGDSSVIVVRIDGVDRSKLPKALRNRTFLDHHDFTERKNWEERLIKHLKPPSLDKNSEKKNSEKTYSLLRNVTEA
ncbi:hemicentin-1-like [Stylophora pistillata]|uniref:hemicentin-1-like n=1 Tax=Stylophora pistillata TaxID=50429 RepID=UPI000C04FC30|nr:hemicentin-1-like [Stylophora pistillata]